MAEIFAPFEVNGNFALDKRQVFKTKKEMKEFDTNHLPDAYFAVCIEDKQLYIYHKNNEVSETTGKWKVVEGSGGSGDFKYTHAGTSTVAVGGISVGTTFNDTPLSTILDNMFFPYTTPTISNVTFTEAAGNYEEGKTVTVSKVKVSYTKGSENITGIKVTDNSGNVLYNGAAVKSGTVINLTTQKTFTDNGSITVTLLDGKDGKSTTANYKFVKYDYYAVSDRNDESPTSGDQSKGSSGEEIPVTDNKYIWYFSPNKDKKIQQYAMNDWHDVDGAKYFGAVEFILNSGKTVTYHAYVTSKLMTSSNIYRLA